jgi:bifunctional DNA-binding transcriptional regulator/antitoxin component of YhaV-PrlF toxin-antitoxin module
MWGSFDRTMSDEEILGTTKVTDRWRISLIKAVREELAESGDGVEIGDRIVFVRRGDEIVLERA